MSAWAEPASMGDWTIAFIPYSYRAATMTKGAFEAARAAWLERVQSKWKASAQEAKPEQRWLAWSEAHAAGVETAEEAKEALRTMPEDQPLPPESFRWPGLDLHIGKVFALTGRGREAVSPLRRVARSCVALVEPTKTVEASFYLGLALETTGDNAGAASAYRLVLDRWGRAKPRSITANKARSRLAALGDKP
jgi:serine/threonine-protein kinase